MLVSKQGSDEDPWILPPEILILQHFSHSITTLNSKPLKEQQLFPRKAPRSLKIDSAKTTNWIMQLHLVAHVDQVSLAIQMILKILTWHNKFLWQSDNLSYSVFFSMMQLDEYDCLDNSWFLILWQSPYLISYPGLHQTHVWQLSIIVTIIPEFQYTISVALSEGSTLFSSLVVLAQQSQKTNNHGWYSLFSSFQYDKMTSANISYQSRLSKLVMILSSSTHAPYDTDTFPFYLCHTILFSFKPICFSISFPSFSTYSFVLFLFIFRFPFILLILLFSLSICIWNVQIFYKIQDILLPQSQFQSKTQSLSSLSDQISFLSYSAIVSIIAWCNDPI